MTFNRDANNGTEDFSRMVTRERDKNLTQRIPRSTGIRE
jgi:hypothetical protein